MKPLWFFPLFFLSQPVFGAIPALQPFLNEHCTDCHDGEVKKGDLDLTTLSTEASNSAALKKWMRVFDRVAAGEMPPAKKKQPSAEAVQDFMGALGADLVRKSDDEKGTVLRRLNRQEYQNTLRDLLGVPVNVIDTLPEDGRAHGFDNIGEALSISGIQMQRYMEAAELGIDAALNKGVKPESIKLSSTLESDRNKDHIGKQWLKQGDGSIVVFNEGGFPSTVIPNLRATKAGNYKLTVTGYGYQIEEPPVFALITGSFNFRNADNVTRSFHELPIGKPGTVEVTLHLDAGNGIWISPKGCLY